MLSEQIKAAAEKARDVRIAVANNKDPEMVGRLGMEASVARHTLKDMLTAETVLSLISAHEARERELVEVLKPFCDLAVGCDIFAAPPESKIKVWLSVADLRRAAKAVKGEG